MCWARRACVGLLAAVALTSGCKDNLLPSASNPPLVGDKTPAPSPTATATSTPTATPTATPEPVERPSLKLSPGDCITIGSDGNQRTATLTLSNDGVGPLRIDPIAAINERVITGNDVWQIQTTSDTCSNRSLRRDDTCTYTVTGRITYDDTPEVRVRINSNAVNTPSVIVYFTLYHTKFRSRSTCG
jgi:hypothetical protein